MISVEQVRAAAAEIAAVTAEEPNAPIFGEVWNRFKRRLSVREFIGAWRVSTGHAIPETVLLCDCPAFFGLLWLSIAQQRKFVKRREPITVLAEDGKTFDRKRCDDLTERDCDVVFHPSLVQEVATAMENGDEWTVQFKGDKVVGILRTERDKS
jgi:hypothetical protein